MGEKCLVCHRISPKIVFRFAHKIFDKRVDTQTVHSIAVEACAIIEKLDNVNRLFFCGRSQASILSGLFYIIGLKRNLKVTQRVIAEALPPKKNAKKNASCLSDGLSEVTVRHSYARWCEVLGLKRDAYER